MGDTHIALLGWVRGQKALLAGGTALVTASGLLVVVQALLLARLVNGSLFHGWSLAASRGVLRELVGVVLGRGVLLWAGEAVLFRSAARVKADVRRRLIRHAQALGPRTSQDSARFAEMLVSGVEALDPYIARFLPQSVLVAVVPLAVVIVVMAINWVAGLVLLLAGPLLVVFMILIGYQAQAANDRQWHALLHMSHALLDTLRGFATLQTFGRCRDHVTVVRRVSEAHRRATLEGLRTAFLTSAALEFFTSLSIAVIAVFFGMRLLTREASFYPAFCVLLLAPEFFLPFRGLATHYHARMNALAAARPIIDRLSLPGPASGTLAFAPSAPIGLTCRDVGVRISGVEVLRDVSCVIPAGRFTAILGASGSGKSRLLDVLLGFLEPTGGRVTINGDTDLGALDKPTWWAHIAYVPQDPRLFAGTIADNIRLGCPQAAHEALRAAARKASALDFIEALPKGFETVIGEEGAGLSVGQIQRIALARAFLKDAPLVVLDEPTAHLDRESERWVSDAIRRLAEGRTLVVVAHRLTPVACADKVLILEAGRVVAEGPPAALTGELHGRLRAGYQGVA